MCCPERSMCYRFVDRKQIAVPRREALESRLASGQSRLAIAEEISLKRLMAR